MKTSTIVGVVVAIIVVGGAWYWYSNSQTGPATPNTQTVSTNNLGGSDQTGGTSAITAATLGTSATLGSYLTAQNTMTLYTYSKDSSGVSNCSGQCAVNWPPYSVAAGTPLAGVAGINGTFATITRADGTTQVTYNGAPLYFWIKDTKPGDTTGQAINGFYVAKP